MMIELKEDKRFVGEVNMRNCNRNILKAMQLADMLLELGQDGDEMREDEGCGVLYGIIRDCGFKIRSMAEMEKQKHIESKRWN